MCRRRCVRCSRCAAPRAARRWQPVGWDAALDEVADRFAGIVQRDGPDAVGLYLSGQLLTEDYYVFNKLAKGLIGTNNVDTNSRLCMSSAVAGYKQSLGADAPPACYDDLALAQTVFITGSNMAWAHPVLFRRLEDARARQPGAEVDRGRPAPHRDRGGGRPAPAAAARHRRGAAPRAAARDAVGGPDRRRPTSPPTPPASRRCATACASSRRRMPAKVCGLQAEDIVQAARWFAGVGEDGTRTPTLSLWCQGLNQSSSGTDKNSTLINLHLATGQIGKPGAGPLSLTGQPNAMGGREVGGLANLLSAHRDLANPAHRAEVAALWGVPDVPARAAARARWRCSRPRPTAQIKALWIVCTNPAQSMPDQATVRRALERAEFVVLQEAYAHTATAAYADLLLPASSWGEKEGTVTNSERRISRVRAAVPAPGQARDDWAIAVDVARRLEARLRPRARPACRRDAVPLRHARAGVERAPRKHARPRPRHHRPELCQRWTEPQQWPYAAGRSAGPGAAVRRRHALPTADGRARFVAPAWRGPAEAARCALPGLADHRPPARPVARHEPHRHAGPAVRACRRAGAGDAPAGADPPPLERRRPGARELAPRRAGAAGPAERGGAAGAGLHRHALGQRVPRRRWASTGSPARRSARSRTSPS